MINGPVTPVESTQSVNSLDTVPSMQQDMYSCDGSYTGGFVMLTVQCDARAGRLVDCSNGYMQFYSNHLNYAYCPNQCTAGVRCQGRYDHVHCIIKWYQSEEKTLYFS